MSIHTRTATIAESMTPSPRSIGKDQPVALASRVMRENGFRHLPVLDGGVCVGIVTERDLSLAETLRDVNPDKLVVEEVMTPDPWVVAPDTELSVVARTMQERRYGAAVVMERGKVTGIFTTIDALRVLAELLESPAETVTTPAPKKATTRTAATRTAAAAKPAVKKAGTKKVADAKPAAKKAATKKAATKKAADAKPATKKQAATATTSSAKKTAAKKVTAEPAAKKTAAKKTAAKKTAAKTTAVKKTAASSAVTRKAVPAKRATAAKTATASKKATASGKTSSTKAKRG